MYILSLTAIRYKCKCRQSKECGKLHSKSSSSTVPQIGLLNVLLHVCQASKSKSETVAPIYSEKCFKERLPVWPAKEEKAKVRVTRP